MRLVSRSRVLDCGSRPFCRQDGMHPCLVARSLTGKTAGVRFTSAQFVLHRPSPLLWPLQSSSCRRVSRISSVANGCSTLPGRAGFVIYVTLASHAHHAAGVPAAGAGPPADGERRRVARTHQRVPQTRGRLSPRVQTRGCHCAQGTSFARSASIRSTVSEWKSRVLPALRWGTRPASASARSHATGTRRDLAIGPTGSSCGRSMPP